jgi:hypothetical protein
MIIQLRHANSHKDLIVSSQSAESNPDSRQVALDGAGGELSWLRIMPRLRVHSEGERVHLGDPVVLEHVKTGLQVGPLANSLALILTLTLTCRRTEPSPITLTYHPHHWLTAPRRGYPL